MSLLISCDIGDVVTVRATLTDEAGVPVTGATVTARARHGSTETSLSPVTDEGAGVYSVNVEPDTHGDWLVRLEAAAPTKAAEEGVIHVRQTRFTTT